LGAASRKFGWKAALEMHDQAKSSLMRVKDAANYLNVSVSTLYGWVWQRRIPFVKVGRALRFEEPDLKQFIRSNRFESRTNTNFRASGPRAA
jgi:excisionase family DNA binding protein